ncbi:MAG: glycosyltransferase family 39 protein [Aggregatilineales bacterium]
MTDKTPEFETLPKAGGAAPPASGWLWVALVSLISLFIAVPSLIGRWRTRATPPVSAASARAETETAPAPAEPAPASAQPALQRRLRWELWLPIIALGAPATLFLPAPAALLLLLALVAGGLLLIARDSDVRLRDLLTWLQRGWEMSAYQAKLLARYSGLLSAGLAGAALALFALAAYAFRPLEFTLYPEERARGVWLMIAGALALGAAIKMAPRLQPIQTPQAQPLTPASTRPGLTLLGVIVLLFAAELSARRLLPAEGVLVASTHVQFVIWALGVLLVGWGISGWRRGDQLLRPRLTLRTAGPLVVIAALALFLRVYQLDQIIRFSVDEVHFSDGVMMLRWDESLPLLRNASVFMPVTMMFAYWNAQAVELFGRDLIGLRIINAFMGTAGVLAVYGLGRTLFDRRTALAAAALLATLPLHVHYSRLAISHLSDPLFGTLALMFLLRALQTNRRLDWALGGIALGMTQYFFEGGRLLFPPLIIAFVAWLFLAWRRELHPHGRGLLSYAIAALFVAVPVYAVIYAVDGARTSRLSDSGVGLEFWQQLSADGFDQQALALLLRRITDPFTFYFTQPELVPQYYGGDQPIVLTIFVPIFFTGVFYLLWRPRTPSIVLVGWISATALGNMLLADPFQSPRYLVALPALALIMAVGITHGLALLNPIQGALTDRDTKRGLALATAAAVSLIAVIQVAYYFGPHVARFNQQARLLKDYGDGVDVVLRSLEFPAGTRIYVISDPKLDVNVPMRILSFMRDDQYEFMTFNASEVDAAFFAGLPRDSDYAFLVSPADARTIELIRAHFTVAPPRFTTTDMPASRAYVLFHAPRSSTQ